MPNPVALVTPFGGRQTRAPLPALFALVSLAFTVPALPATAAHAVDPAAVDALFREWDKPTTPGVALAVIHDGKIIYERSYGQAVLPAPGNPAAGATPITPDTSFYIGSVSKQFAAACIALLHQRGVISLDDDIRQHVPELPDYGAKITVRHCVHHTSGLRDYLALRDLAGENPNATFGDDYVLTLLSRQKALNFPPGSRHLYSNSGYFVLSLIVRRASGKSLRDFAAANLFGPLGMPTAQFRDRHNHPIANRANGYSPATAGNTPTSGYRLNNPNFDVVGAGGVFMSARDFLAWDQNFYTPRVGDAAFLSLLQTPGELNDGTKLTYAFGLTIGKYRDLDIVEHAGAYGGFRAHAIRFPAQRFSVVCFTNLSSMTPSRFTRQVADLYLAEAFSAPATAEATVAALPPTKASAKKTSTAKTRLTKLARFSGNFASDELGVLYRITADTATGELHLHRGPAAKIPLIPISENVFTAGSLRLEFTALPNAPAASFTVDESRARGVVFTRADRPAQN